MPLSIGAYIIASGCILVSWGLFRLYSRSNDTVARRAGLRLPPGPPRVPFLGNLFNFPQHWWPEAFNKWLEQYGDIVYVDVLGIPMFIIGSLDAAEELASKRAGNYSNRPTTVMATKLLDVTWTLVMAQPGAAVNDMRKLLRKEIGSQSLAQYDPIIQQEAENLARELNGFSGYALDRIEDIVAAVIVRMAYGSEVFRLHGKELVDLDKKAITYVTWVLKQLWIVDILPFLQYLPSWFPGASFHRVAKRSRQYLDQARNIPFNFAKDLLNQGLDDPSISSKYLRSCEFDPEIVRDAVSQLYGAGVDTTGTTVANFLYEMVMHPDIQKRVQEELDSIVGRDGIPTISDCARLPYHNAVWKECLRIHAPAPLGVPHVSAKADTWNGYYVPKGTMMHCHIGHMMIDPNIWGEDSTTLRPERFLERTDLPDPGSIAFGFGKRVCPGRALAERISILFTAVLLSAYDVRLVEGEVPPLSNIWDDSTVRRPSKFQCQLRSR